jgi:hypothetical protein
LMPAGEAVETILRDLDLPGTRDSGNYMIWPPPTSQLVYFSN